MSASTTARRISPRPERGPERRKHLRVLALATGLGDKAVSLIYERVLRKEQSKVWVERCATQILGVLAVLEQERAAATTSYLFGDGIAHADIALACVLRFTREAHPQLFDASRYPALAAHADRCEALPPFMTVIATTLPVASCSPL